MKKRLLSSLLLGALLVSSTSVFVSCKDYDDDVSELQAQITGNKTAIDGTVVTLQNEVNSLKSQLEAKTAELNAAAEAAKAAGDKAEANAKTAEEHAKKVTELAGDVANITARIKTAEDAIASLNNLRDMVNGKVDQATYENALKDVYAKVEAVETGLGNQLKEFETLKKGLNDEETARKAAIADLEQQLAALNTFKETLQSVNFADLASKTDVSALETKIKEMEESLTNLSPEGIANVRTMLTELDEQAKTIVNTISVLNVMINKTLTSLVFNPDEYYHGIEATSFRFLETFKYSTPAAAWNIKETRGYFEDPQEAAIVIGENTVAGARTDHNRYDSTAVALTNDLWANYYMNPSGTNGDDIKEVKIISGDKNYVNTRSADKADAGLSVLSWKPENGMLKVQINVEKPEQIKAVVEDYWAKGQTKPMVTVFATQAIVAKGDADTTITSDFATLYADKMGRVSLAHIVKKDLVYFTGQLNDHCGACSINEKDGSHLMATVNEAALFPSQDTVYYKETLDLRKLVETHWNTFNADGNLEHITMSAADFEKYGFKYKFELTSVHFGNNATDESAHAAILGDGYTFRPQNPRMVQNGNTFEGVQVAWDAEDIADFIGDNALQAVGRTPIVRVSLIDTVRNNTLDYGYIRIRIANKPIEPVTPTHRFNGIVVDYSQYGASSTVQDICPKPTIKGYAVYQTKWIQTSYDIYNKLNMSREEFEQHYNEDPVRDDDTDFAQFYQDGVDEYGDPVYKKRAIADRIGVFSNEPDMDNETHTQTSTLKWELTDADVAALYNKWVADTQKNSEKTYTLTAAVMYEDVDGHKGYERYKDVYVVFSTNITFKPTTVSTVDVNVDWSNAKILRYWYKTDTNTMGVKGESQDEIHVNVPSVEDERYTALNHENFKNTLSSEFMNNEVVSASIVKGTNGFTFVAHTYSLVFDKANNGKQFKGASGQNYTLSVSNDGRSLLAGGQQIAKLVVNDASWAGTRYEPNFTDIQYVYSDNACDLLNYASHNVFNHANDSVKHFLNVIVSLEIDKGEGGTECEPLKLTNSEFNVRFLRPLDVSDAEAKIEDASADGRQKIYLDDLFTFSDWRDQWGTPEKDADYYYQYYGIKGVKIEKVGVSQVISLNHDVKASLNTVDDDNSDNWTPLYQISNQLNFKYMQDTDPNSENYGKYYLDYQNLSSTVNNFKLEIPVVIEYVWGKFHTTATVTVLKTKNNARRK